MIKFVSTVLALSALASGAAIAEPSILGTYKVLSFTVFIDGSPKETLGKAHGYVIFTPSRFASIITADQRRFGTSVEARAGLWDSILAYAGPYRVEGQRITVSVDTSWNESWNGTQQERRFEFDGKVLTLTTMPAPYSRDPSKTVYARVVVERID